MTHVGAGRNPQDYTTRKSLRCKTAPVLNVQIRRNGEFATVPTARIIRCVIYVCGGRENVSLPRLCSALVFISSLHERHATRK